METKQVFIVSGYSDEEKKKLQALKAIYVSEYKGYLITQEQLDALKSGEVPEEKHDMALGKKKDIFIDDLLTEWKVSGNTYRSREKIKELGGRWSASDKTWRIKKTAATKEQLEKFFA